MMLLFFAQAYAGNCAQENVHGICMWLKLLVDTRVQVCETCYCAGHEAKQLHSGDDSRILHRGHRREAPLP